MTKRWKLKTNSSNILLVLITLILVKAEWIKAENSNYSYYTNSLESSNETEETNIYVGNDEISEYFFRQSENNNSYILEGINKCLNNFQLITCVKMLLLRKINEAVVLMEDPNITQRDLRLLRGALIFKLKNETTDPTPDDDVDDLSLDEEIATKVMKIFRKRSLLINLLPKVQIEIEPAPKENSDFICFSYTIRKGEDSLRSDQNEKTEGRKRKKGGGMSMMMMVPQLLMLGLMPFTLASLKAMVMNAVMINMMALNGAIFMTVRNLVFGPREGDNVKYVNYGYSKDRQTQSKRPVLIIHSPAAFVKQPPVRKKPNHYYHGKYHFGGNTHSPHHHHHHHHENEVDVDNYGNKYYYTLQEDEHNHYRRRGQNIRRRNDQRVVSGV